MRALCTMAWRRRLLALGLLASGCRASDTSPSPSSAPVAEAATVNGNDTPRATTASAGDDEAPAAAPPAARDPASPAQCQELEKKVKYAVTTAYFAMSAGGAFLGAFDEGWRALDECPGSEPLWYTVARLAEIGFDRLPMQVAGVRVESAADLAALARARQPGSARIAVVDARTHGDVERARGALALDPSYAPGRVALAAALFAQHQIDEALPLSDAPGVPGAGSLRAQILTARGRPGDAKLAERLARRELSASWDAPEPYDVQPVRCAAQEALALALHAQRAKQTKAELEKAVQCGSARANELLQGLAAPAR